MGKKELIEAVINECNTITKADAARAVNAVTAAIAESLCRGENVTIPQFGTFEVRSVKEREGRNPQTGETMKIAAHNRAGFKPSKKLNELLN